MGLLIILAFLVRSYNLHDWLYFKSDQARDANAISAAFENGPSELPLLGPRAGGTDLFLGPAYLYIQFLTTKITGNLHPPTFAYSNLAFLLLSIPLFYLLLRQFFHKGVSLLVSSIYASSYVLAQYSRFSWNPNSIPFWGLSFLLGIYKSSTSTNKAGWWLILSAFSYGIVSQLHFLALLGYPFVAILFWIFYPPKKICWKFWVSAIAILLIMYSPVFLSDIKNNGNNLKNFQYALTNRAKERPLNRSLIKTGEMYGKYYTFTLTSFVDDEFSKAYFLGDVIFLIGIGSIAYRRNKLSTKKGKLFWHPFIGLVLCWFLVFLFIHLKLAFDINRTRFWFPSFHLPFIFLAFFFSVLWEMKNKATGRSLVFVLTLLLVIANTTAIINWYKSLAIQKQAYFLKRTWTSTTLQQKDLITLSNMTKTISHMKTRAEQENKIVCFNAESPFASAYKYIHRHCYPNYPIKRVSKTLSKHPNNCMFFVIEKDSKDAQYIIDEKFEQNYKISLEDNPEHFGRIVLWRIKDFQTVQLENKKDPQENTNTGTTDTTTKKQKPGRKPRVYWKDLF